MDYDFTTREEAEAFRAALLVDGYERIAPVARDADTGEYYVFKPSDRNWIESEAKHVASMRAEGDARKAADFNRIARRLAAEDAASGLTGRDAQVFVDGFCGVPAKIAHPRAEGRESIFRAGRAAAQSTAGQRAIRAAAVRASSLI